jgi:predicted ATPase/DNA-binding SARP family transcriptional activator
MEFRILGPLEVLEAGRSLHIPGGKARVLLAILLLNANEVQSTDRLIDLLWGEDPPATADKALQVHVSQLRKALVDEQAPNSPIHTRSPGYVLALEAHQLDLLQFLQLVDEGRRAKASGDVRSASDRLHGALALWRGSPLSDFTFEPFAHSEISRLEELRLAAIEDRLDADLDLGRHTEVAAELEGLVAEHALRERLRAQLMVALYRAGRQADALRVYDDGRRILDAELGIDPSPTIQELHRRILAQDQGLELRKVQTAGIAARRPAGPMVLIIDFPNRPQSALGRKLLDVTKDAVESAGGLREIGERIFQGRFEDPAVGVQAAVTVQSRLISTAGELPPARVVLDTADPSGRDGPAGTSSAGVRLLSLGHPGQVLLTHEAAQAVAGMAPSEVALLDLGEHRLPDLSRRVRVFELDHPDLPGDFPPLRSSDSAPNNLSLQLTSFVGRRAELDSVKHMLDDNRLVTLTGSGGCGKSRLALHVGAEAVPHNRDGVWLVELADVTTPEQVAQTVIATLNVPEQPDQTHLDALIEHARARSMLLILDNCEHLVEACVELAIAVLGACAGVRILATSREVFAVPGEAVLRVPSLGIPPLSGEPPHAVSEYESVRLFADRAAAVAPDFILDAEAAADVAQICRRLDGLPLAIELAAARLRTLTIGEVAARLDDRFRLLTGGRRGSISRHQTLRAVMDWSFELLPADEAALLSRLSVFAGGFNLAAAEGVCSDERVPADSVLDLLARLVDKSLVSIERGEQGWRYRMLETVREYAWERLTETGDAMGARRRHASYFLQLAQSAEHELQGPDLSRWADQLEAERDNFRAALTWFEEEGLGVEQLSLAAALWRYCYLRGRYRQGREWLGAALDNAHDAPPLLLANALYGAGALAFFECDYEDASTYCTQALDLFTAANDVSGAGRTLNRLGAIARERADYERALELHERSLASFREVGDEWEVANSLQLAGFSAWLASDLDRAVALSGESVDRFRHLNDKERTAWALLDLGAVALYREDLHEAERLLSESLSLFEDIDFKEGIAWIHNLLGLTAFRSADLDRALELLTHSLTIHVELNDRWRAASVLEALAALLCRQNEHATACRLFACAGGIRGAIGTPVPQVERGDHDRTETALRKHLGAAAFEEAWKAGSALTLEAAAAVVSAYLASVARGAFTPP